MELELNQKDIEQLALDWANAKFPGCFNVASLIGHSYNIHVLLTRIEPEPPPATPERVVGSAHVKTVAA